MGILDYISSKSTPVFEAAPIRRINSNFKGEIIQDKTRLSEDYGEEHPFDYRLAENAYTKVSIVSGAIDKIVDFVWGTGFHTKSEDDRAKAVIDAWMDKVDFSKHGRQWLREALIKGTGYLEIGGKLTEAPQGVKVLNACNMYIKRDKKGTIKEYTQVLKSNVGKNKKSITFSPERIAALPLNVVGSCAYGLGKIWPNIKAINNFLQVEKDMHKLVMKKANVPTIV